MKEIYGFNFCMPRNWKGKNVAVWSMRTKIKRHRFDSCFCCRLCALLTAWNGSAGIDSYSSTRDRPCCYCHIYWEAHTLRLQSQFGAEVFLHIRIKSSILIWGENHVIAEVITNSNSVLQETRYQSDVVCPFVFLFWLCFDQFSHINIWLTLFVRMKNIALWKSLTVNHEQVFVVGFKNKYQSSSQHLILCAPSTPSCEQI